MESDNVEKLLEKYFEATTTVAEEEILKQYFTQESVPSHLKQYASMFQYFSTAKNENLTKQVVLPTSKNVKKKRYRWFSAAAAVAICVGLYFNQPKTIEDKYSPEEIAAAQEALALLGVNFNKGAHQISYLDEFERTTNKFILKN